MTEEERKLYELAYGYRPIATTGLLHTTPQVAQPTIGLTQAALPSLPTTPIAEPTATIGLAAQPVDAVPQINDLPVAELTAYFPMYSHQNDLPENLAATEPNLQGVTPFSMASTEMTPAQINAGMAEVELPYFSRFPLAQQAMTQGEYDAIEHIDATYGGASQESTKDTAGRMAWKEIAKYLPNSAISTVLHSGVPFSDFTGDNIETATTAESIKDALNNIVIMDAKKSGVPKDDLIASVLSGANTLIQTDANQLTAAADYVSKGGKLDKDDARQMAFQVDEFVDLVPATTPSTISKVSRPSTKKAAIGTKKNEAEEAEKARMRALGKQQAAAQRKRDIAKAKAAKAQEAMIQAALERAAQAQAERAMVDRARAIMDKYSGRRESPENYMSAEERDVVAAAQVDTFAGIGDRSGEVRKAMRSVGYGGSNWT